MPVPESPNEPIIDIDGMIVTKRDLYEGKIQELRAKIEANAPNINWRKITFHVNGFKGATSVTSIGKAEGAKIKAAYPV